MMREFVLAAAGAAAVSLAAAGSAAAVETSKLAPAAALESGWDHSYQAGRKVIVVAPAPVYVVKRRKVYVAPVYVPPPVYVAPVYKVKKYKYYY